MLKQLNTTLNMDINMYDKKLVSATADKIIEENDATDLENITVDTAI